MRFLIIAIYLFFCPSLFGQEKDTSFILKTSKCQLKYTFHEYKTDSSSATFSTITFKFFEFGDYSNEALKLNLKKEKVQFKLIFDKDCHLVNCEIVTKSKIKAINEELELLFPELITEYNKNNFYLIWNKECSSQIITAIFKYDF